MTQSQIYSTHTHNSHRDVINSHHSDDVHWREKSKLSPTLSHDGGRKNREAKRFWTQKKKIFEKKAFSLFLMQWKCWSAVNSLYCWEITVNLVPRCLNINFSWSEPTDVFSRRTFFYSAYDARDDKIGEREVSLPSLLRSRAAQMALRDRDSAAGVSPARFDCTLGFPFRQYTFFSRRWKGRLHFALLRSFRFAFV